MRDRIELFRRIAFSILVTNTDDHFRNHGFLWTGKKGWKLSPLYDINPVANGNRILSTRIDYDDASASIEQLWSVAEYFLSMKSTNQIIDECRVVVRKWRDFAQARGALESETKLIRSAFEHEELDRYLEEHTECTTAGFPKKGDLATCILHNNTYNWAVERSNSRLLEACGQKCGNN